MPALKHIANLRSDRSGATAIEYGLIVCMIVIALMVAFDGLAARSTSLWNNVSSTSGGAIYEAVG
jgi:pilus assembly protein Flp/PilA